MTMTADIHFKTIRVLLYMVVCSLGFEANGQLSVADTAKEKQDAFINDLEKKVRSTLMDGGSTPIGFSGEARVKIQYHEMRQYPSFMRDDRSWIQSGWEGNQGMLKLGMIAALGRNVTLYSKIGFQNTFPGNYLSDTAGKGMRRSDPGFVPCQQRHDKINDPAYIHEDLIGGIALRTHPASFMLRLGGLQWIEASPLTVWDYQRRMFAWDYLPFEIEEPMAVYYDKNIIKGQRTGRAAWNKKPFNGIGLESIDLPLDFYAELFYGCFEPFDRHEREYVDLGDNLAYYSIATEAKGHGIGDSYRHAYIGRLAKDNSFGNLTIGVNFSTVRYDPDVTSNALFRGGFPQNPGSGLRTFYKEPMVVSADLRGALTDSLSVHFEAAAGKVDTNFYLLDNTTYYSVQSQGIRSSCIRPALFSEIKSGYVLPASLEVFYAAPGFYSPFSLAKSVDGFYPFGANLVGPGNFVASAYNQNLTGFNFHMSPPGMEGNGHCRVTYGSHMQVRPGPDVLYFPYRLNGADLFSFFQSSYYRWGLGLLDWPLAAHYRKRIGDESYELGKPPQTAEICSYGPEAGGMRSQSMEIYEGFVPYENAAEAQANINDPTATVFERSRYIPQHRKYAFNVELDAAYDFGKWVGWNNGVFLSLYTAINGISTSPKTIAFNEHAKGMLLWGALARFEPAIALNEKLYILGLAGCENWRAAKAWMADSVSTGAVYSSPIDYREIAWGLGFDWQAIERLGIHGRCKWMQHHDEFVPGNNWKTPLVSVELKMWF